MIDTIRLVLPGFRLPVGFDDEKWNLDDYYRRGKDRSMAHLRTGQFHELLKHVRVFNRVGCSDLVVEASLPKLIYGHNVLELTPDSLMEAVKRLDIIIAWGLTDFHGRPLLEVPSVLTWRVARIDVFANYRPTCVPFQSALRGLMNLQPSGRMVPHYVGNSTAYFRTEAKRKRVEIAIYDKAAETRKKDPLAAQVADEIIRVEVRLRGQDTIRRDFRLKDGPRFQDVAKAGALSDVLVRRLQTLNIEEGLESIVTGREELAKRVGKRAARRLWPFAKEMQTATRREAAIAMGLSQGTARKYERELRTAGLFPAAVSATGIIEELGRQVRSQRPTKADRPAHSQETSAMEERATTGARSARA